MCAYWLVLIMGIIALLIVWIREGEFGLGIISLLCTSIITFFVVFMADLVINDGVQKEYYSSKTKQIVALRDTNSMSGSFFLGSGSINGTLYYIYYIKRDDGGFELKKTPTQKL